MTADFGSAMIALGAEHAWLHVTSSGLQRRQQTMYVVGSFAARRDCCLIDYRFFSTADFSKLAASSIDTATRNSCPQPYNGEHRRILRIELGSRGDWPMKNLPFSVPPILRRSDTFL
jgi:hypothetical protein